MADIFTIREALATQLETIDGLRGAAFMPDKISVPQAIVGEVTIVFDLTMARGIDQLDFKIRLYVSRATDRASQMALDGYLKGSGALSIKAALESDLTLGGTAHQLHVTRMDGYGVYVVGEQQYLGADFAVTVWAEGA